MQKKKPGPIPAYGKSMGKITVRLPDHIIAWLDRDGKRKRSSLLRMILDKIIKKESE